MDEMWWFAVRLVAQAKVNDAAHRHDSQAHTPCSGCDECLLWVKTKRGKMLVYPDRECDYRRSVKQTTNVRRPNRRKGMEL